MGENTKFKQNAASGQNLYSLFSQLNGKHSFQTAVPSGFVSYQVRKRPGGKILFFNFELAIEMGLLPKGHPKAMNAALQKEILNAFALVVINEWDLEKGKKFPNHEIKPNPYMATRYLQLQHPDKRGKTSGDGRGIWNGEFKSDGITWDVSSSGTGATCLSPAAAIEKKAFKTGDTRVCYGNGYNCVDDGLSAALMSEIFHRNGIATERTLAIIEFERGSSINVRASKNLFRPSHLFLHLKQSNLVALKSAVDFFIQRQIENREWNCILDNSSSYEFFSRQMALTFSELAAQFESEYIFCWLEWDGDNILATGGIIDYGSVRQFGLFHDEYRYDDGDRFSTKLSEQRKKARYLVQTFAQMKDYLLTGQKRKIDDFKNDPLLTIFDNHFEMKMNQILLDKTGIHRKDRDYLLKHHLSEVESFRKKYAYFERKQSKRGIYSVSDGVQSNAIFSARDALRELPKLFLKNDQKPIDSKSFINLIKSSYAKKSDLRLTTPLQKKIEEFQTTFINLAHLIVSQKESEKTVKKLLLEMTMRSSLVNPAGRITGNGILSVTAVALRLRTRWNFKNLQTLVEHFIYHQIPDPNNRPDVYPLTVTKEIQKELNRVRRYVWNDREGI